MKKWTSKDIKTLRKKYKLSQKALGDLLGVSEQYIYYLERGLRTPSKTLRLLLDCIEKQFKKEEGKVERRMIEFKIQRIAPNPSGIDIVSCRRETRNYFPPPGHPFTLVIDEKEYTTSIRNLKKTGWTSFAKTFYQNKRVYRAELCGRHRLREGDSVLIEIEIPNQRYILRRR
jgi:transcriptional regulator with XRE-family HTH domain